MADLLPKEKTVKTIARYPVAWVAGFLACLCVFFITQNITTNKDDKTACYDMVAAISKERDSARNQLVQILLLDKERREQERHERDSTINAVIGDKAKAIINQKQHKNENN